MTDIIDSWYRDKKLTYHNIWKCNDTQFPEGTWSWVLFFTEAVIDPTYEYGISGSEEEAEEDIKKLIGTHLKNRGVL